VAVADRKLSWGARIRSLRSVRTETLASILVVVLVALVVWGSSWAFSDRGTKTSSATGAAQSAEPGTAPGSASATDEAGGTKKAGDRRGDTSGEGTQGDTASAAALDKSVRRFRAAQRRLAAQVTKRLKARSEPVPVSFRVASFNVLGDSHTGPGGNKPSFYPDGGPRMDMAIAALRSHAIDVVGFQEFESTQYAMFTARAGEYSLYPGLALGTKSVRFNIAWRSSAWSLVEAHTLSIPYAGGSRIDMPVVLLESTATKRRAWFANFHNPADTPSLGNNGRWRAEAAGIEIAHLTQLHQQDGVPVVVTGDFNERAEIFCRFTAGGVFSAAAGGSTGVGCAPPSSMQVDWIFGSSGVSFADYAVSDTGRASDHAMVHATATLAAAE
jgi:endonuclease/exonuclease/phosphatase family metal-dependent hydrolase